MNDVNTIYLINLKKREDKKQDFMNDFNKSDLNDAELILYYAVDGSKIDMNNVPLTEKAKDEYNDFKKINKRRHHHQLTNGAIGCYYSHYNVWKLFENNKNDISMVCEDDTNLPKLNTVQNALYNVPDDWDILLLGHRGMKGKQINRYIKQVDKFYCTHCYLMNKNFIRKVNENIHLLFPIGKQLDSAMSDLCEMGILNMYACTVDYVIQKNLGTNIQSPMIKT
jgi:GR25 family glycosyltransferase involved in LPS biosynthesis